MKTSNIILIAIVALLCILGFSMCSSYNGLVTKREAVDQKWAEVQNQYQRRFDLIPNLVETVKGYAKHESSTLENVTDARSGISKLPADAALLAANQQARELSSAQPTESGMQALQSLDRQLSIYVNAVHEAYPDLKASQNFENLQFELAGTENRIEKARNEYTQSVQTYNVSVRRFPASIVASMFGFDPSPQFQAVQDAQSAPKVNF